MAIDYSSKPYWETRLAKERDKGFEWLVSSTSILPIVSSQVDRYTVVAEPLKILHFGCGSSSLGTEIQRHFGGRVIVSDSDYASSSISPAADADTIVKREVPLLDMDVLSIDSLRSTSPKQGWDLIIDKSTADCISCGQPVTTRDDGDSCTGETSTKSCLHILSDNLSQVVPVGGIWISVSYSASRYDYLSQCSSAPWRVVGKEALLLAPTVSNNNHIVYHPSTGIWAWVLERV